MQLRTRLVLTVVAVLLATAFVASAQTITVTGVESRLTTDPGDQYDPAISGNLVVFTDYRTIDTDVYYVDLSAGTEHPVIVAPGNQQLTSVDAGRIVYTDYRTNDVVLLDTTTSPPTAMNLTRADKDALGRPFNALDPAISGVLVAWHDSRDGNMEIYAKDVATNEERRITDAPEIDQMPSVNGTVIVWQRCASGGTCDIWSYDWSTSTTTQITNTPACNERVPNINGNTIVYQSDCSGGNDIYAYDLASGAEKHLDLPGDQANPHVSGDFVSFDDLSAGLYHIKMWYMPTGQVFDVTSGTAGQYLNDIEGNRVVYTDDRNGDLEIYMTTFTYTVEQHDPAEQIAALIDQIEALNLKRGIENSLDAKLNAALGALGAAQAGDVTTACNVIGAFINEVNAQAGKAITASDAAALLASAAQVRTTLGCP